MCLAKHLFRISVMTKILRIGLLLIPLYFLVQGTLLAVTNSPLYDDSGFATVAKNLARGVGYATTYEGISYFNPEIVTGPAVIFSTALLIRIFGNAYFLPGLFNWLLCCGLLILVIKLVRPHFAEAKTEKSILALAILVFLLAIFTDESPHRYLRIWTSLFGEVPSSLLIIIGTLLLFTRQSLGSWLTAGLCFGIAFCFKFIVLLSIVPIAIYYAYTEFIGGQLNKTKVLHSFSCLLCAVFPALCFYIYQLSVLGFTGLAELHAREVKFFKVKGSGLNFLDRLPQDSFLETIRTVAGYFYENLLVSIHSPYFGFIKHFGGVCGIILLLVIILVLGYRLNRQFFADLDTRARNVLIAISLAAITHLIWWTFICTTHWIRHAMQFWIYFSFLVCWFLVRQVGFLEHTRSGSRRLVFASLVAVIFLVWPMNPLLIRSAKAWRANDPRAVALVRTARWLDENARDNYLCGAGWLVNPDLEYVLPAVMNFKSCQVDDVVGGKLQQRGLKPLLVRSDFWNISKAPFVRRDVWEQQTKTRNSLVAFCEKNKLFEAAPFVVSRCY